MGQDVSNANLKSHAHGTDPLTGDYELSHHWGNKSLDDTTVVTRADAEDLVADAVTSQAAFDTTAGALASWYAFSGLSSADRDTARATCRKACSMLSGL